MRDFPMTSGHPCALLVPTPVGLWQANWVPPQCVETSETDGGETEKAVPTPNSRPAKVFRDFPASLIFVFRGATWMFLVCFLQILPW